MWRGVGPRRGCAGEAVQSGPTQKGGGAGVQPSFCCSLPGSPREEVERDTSLQAQTHTPPLRHVYPVVILRVLPGKKCDSLSTEATPNPTANMYGFMMLRGGGTGGVRVRGCRQTGWGWGTVGRG